MLISSSEPRWRAENGSVVEDPTSSVYQAVDGHVSQLVIKDFTVDLAGRYLCQDFSVEDDFYLIPVDSVTSEGQVRDDTGCSHCTLLCVALLLLCHWQLRMQVIT